MACSGNIFPLHWRNHPHSPLLNSIHQVLYVDEIGSVLAADRSDPYRMLYEHMKPDSNRLGLFNGIFEVSAF